MENTIKPESDNKVILPMLARDVQENKLKFPLTCTRKIDGVWAGIQNSKLFARSLKQFENKHVTEFYSNPCFEGLRGELIVGSVPNAPDLCRNTGSAVRTIAGSPETSLWCFDYITPSTEQKPYYERLKLLAERVEQLQSKGYTNIFMIDAYFASNLEEYLQFQKQFLQEGYEGIVVRTPDSKHKQGRSSSVKPELWRWKPYATAEIKVTRLVEEQTNKNQATINELGYTTRSSHKQNLEGSDTLGAIVGTLVTPLLDCFGKQVAEVGTELTIATGSLTAKELKQLWYNQDQLLGKLVTFEYMSFGLKDKPRFAQFKSIRDEVDLS